LLGAKNKKKETFNYDNLNQDIGKFHHARLACVQVTHEADTMQA
jgi:hypothetical protein